MSVKYSVHIIRLQEAMARLPNERTSAYFEALHVCPDIFAAESDPVWFLEFHDYDVDAAANRLAFFWELRKLVFQDRAFFPLVATEAGILAKPVRDLLQTRYFQRLPVDKCGRAVMYFDRNRIIDAGRDDLDFDELKRQGAFFNLSLLIQEEDVRRNGVVFVMNFFDSPDKPGQVTQQGFERLSHRLNHAFPFALKQFYMISSPPKPARRFALNMSNSLAEEISKMFIGLESVKVIVGSRKSVRKQLENEGFGADSTLPWFDNGEPAESASMSSTGDLSATSGNPKKRRFEVTSQERDLSNDEWSTKKDSEVQPGLAVKLSFADDDRMPAPRQVSNSVESSDTSKVNSSSNTCFSTPERASQAAALIKSFSKTEKIDSRKMAAVVKTAAAEASNETLDALTAAIMEQRDKEALENEGRRRQLGIMYSKRKRQRQKERFGRLQDVVAGLEKDHAKLIKESKELEQALQHALAHVIEYERSGGAAALVPSLPPHLVLTANDSTRLRGNVGVGAAITGPNFAAAPNDFAVRAQVAAGRLHQKQQPLQQQQVPMLDLAGLLQSRPGPMLPLALGWPQFGQLGTNMLLLPPAMTTSLGADLVPGMGLHRLQSVPAPPGAALLNFQLARAAAVSGALPQAPPPHGPLDPATAALIARLLPGNEEKPLHVKPSPDCHLPR